MIIKEMTIENFAGTQSRKIEFDEKFTLISGANESGKTTIANALFWLFADRSIDGSQAKNVRPHDADGKDVDHIVTAVEVVTTDGHTFRKEQKQKWTKKRGTEEMVYGGLVNTYFINGVEKREGDFKAFVEAIVPTDALLYGMSAKAFTALTTKDRRAKLIPLAEVTDEEIIATNEAFKEVAPLLAVGTVAEIVTGCNRAIKGFSAKRKEIPPRIDELSKATRSYSDGDSEEEAERLKGEADKLRAQIANMDADIKGYQKSGTDALAMQFELTELKNKLRGDYQKRKEDVERRIRGLQSEQARTESDIERENYHYDRLDEMMLSYDDSLTKARNALEDVEKWKFEYQAYSDEDYVKPIADKCPTCGRAFSEKSIQVAREKAAAVGMERYLADKEEAHKRYLAEKERAIQSFKERIKKEKETFSSLRKERETVRGTLRDLSDKKETLNKDISAAVAERNALVEPNVDDNEEVVAMVAEIRKLREEEAKGKELSSGKRREMQDVLDNLIRNRERMSDRMKSVDDSNVVTANRITQLTTELAEYTDKEMAETRKRDLVKAFEVARIKAVTEKLNSRFRYVKWTMFAEQVNGGFADVCIPTVEGTSYDGLLNHGNKLLAELDIALAFQNFYGVQLPLILDDAESVDAERIPKVDRQLIVLRREGEKGSPLTVKKGV